MRDINGQEIHAGGMAQLLCEVIEVGPAGVHLRILNSDQELAVGAKQDEVLGGLVADSELTAFVETPAPTGGWNLPARDPDAGQDDGVAVFAFE